MHTRSVLIPGAALLAAGVWFAAVSAWTVEHSIQAEQRYTAAAPKKPAATPMTVYKSPT